MQGGGSQLANRMYKLDPIIRKTCSRELDRWKASKFAQMLQGPTPSNYKWWFRIEN
jgi:hypothetical protein